LCIQRSRSVKIQKVRNVMSNTVKIIECPRDSWQGLPKNMPAEVKADYLRVLIAAGFKHIDAVSFVSRTAVPQMADSELVLEYLDPPDDVEIIGIVVNAKGAERAVKTGSVQTLGFPYSISPTFLQGISMRWWRLAICWRITG
jgi:hydroxymethylglutaryl-CoA lyase